MENFIKRNSLPDSDMLLCEARGLEYLASTLSRAGVGGVRVPEVISVTREELVIPKIKAGRATPALMEMLGEGLAAMHGLAQPYYGFDEDNYIGLAPQRNRQTEDWGGFFVQDRLGFQVSLVKDHAVRARFAQVLETHGEPLASFLNQYCDHPSLLHGDLWSGNALFDDHSPWLIDPAVYYGDREADLAMTELFGGFSPEFYQAYERIRPITSAYNTKRDIYNLYHNLNHYNLFGSAYLGACERGVAVIASVE